MPTPAKFAVAVIALRRNEEVEGNWECILVARKDDHSRWSLPGGKVDPSETSIFAATREFWEETGVSIPLDRNRRDDMPRHRLLPQGTVLDSDGYLTTFYLLDTTDLRLPETFDVADHEAPVRWGSVYELLEGPYGRENADRLRKIGIIR